MAFVKSANFTRWLGTVLALTLITAGSTWVIQGQTGSRIRILARGAGATMLEGGSGARCDSGSTAACAGAPVCATPRKPAA
jgi:hypothetical protein